MNEIKELLETAKKEEESEALNELFQKIKKLKSNYGVLTPSIKIELGIIEFEAKNILARKKLT